MTEGDLEHSGNPTDFAIDGEGFFAVNNNGKVLYTKDGEFKVADGYLVTKEGYEVLDVNGNPVRFTDKTEIDSQGNIYDETGKEVSKLGLYSIEDPQKFGYTYYTSSNATPTDFRILQGYVEKSNVDAVKNMVNLISASRHFDIVNRVITTEDELTNKVLNTVGSVR